jgi:hypothetical protein
MTVEQLVRDQLDRATQHVPAGPDLESAVSTGRRRRRNRRAGLASVAVAAVTAVVAAPLAVSAFLSDPTLQPLETRVADQPPAPPVAAPATDYVPGTDIDETMAAVVADHLVSLPAAEDVYPSDSAHPGPMTDADFARATDWIAAYALDGQEVEVSMGYADPAVLACEVDCTSTAMSGWELQDREASGWHETDPGGAKQWVFVTQVVRGSFYVNLREQIVAPTLDAARTQRTLDHEAVVALVTDPRLTFQRP